MKCKEVAGVYETDMFCVSFSQATDSDLNILQHEQESFVILYQEKYQIEEALARQIGTPSEPRLRQRKEQVDQNLSQKANSILEKRMVSHRFSPLISFPR